MTQVEIDFLELVVGTRGGPVDKTPHRGKKVSGNQISTKINKGQPDYKKGVLLTDGSDEA
ncbi:hypothetical protein ABDD95_18930 [Mucilaginibacter sp. PAMB04274]|uniref:hypothetical protein n=1 Tax=Mucilaginibacter sp. PAMB04274 TaxID=3138568 RepID=UPI0031F6030A